MTKRLFATFIAGVTPFTLLPNQIHAAITYVDATWGAEGNTSLGDESTFTPTTGGNINDDNWDVADSYGNGGSYLVSNGEQKK